MPLKALDGMRRAFTEPSMARWGYLLVAVMLLALIIVLVRLVLRQLTRSRQVQAAWQQLATDMARWRLNRQEQELLRGLVMRVTPLRPLDLVERVEVFERAVHRHFVLLGVPRKRDESIRRAGALVHGLRTKLGLRHTRGRVYYGTRELAAGQALHLAPKGKGDTPSIWARVGGVREDLLELTHVRPADPALRDRAVEAVFFDGKAAFRFASKVLEVNPDEATCLLAHSMDVRSAGAREFHRVDVKRPVTFRAAWEDDDVRREGTILDLGAGGLGLLCPCYYEDGEELAIHFQPDLYLPPRRGSDQDRLPDRRLKGTILKTRRTADGRCVHHVEFRDVGEADREYLFRLVREIELGGGAE